MSLLGEIEFSGDSRSPGDTKSQPPLLPLATAYSPLCPALRRSTSKQEAGSKQTREFNLFVVGIRGVCLCTFIRATLCSLAVRFTLHHKLCRKNRGGGRRTRPKTKFPPPPQRPAPSMRALAAVMSGAIFPKVRRERTRERRPQPVSRPMQPRQSSLLASCFLLASAPAQCSRFALATRS